MKKLLGLLLVSSLALADSQAELAARANEEGKQLMFDGRYADASAKFRDAVARVPDPKYFFNLCTAEFMEGRFADALTACDAVGKNKPAPELQDKANKLIERIKTEASKQHVKLK